MPNVEWCRRARLYLGQLMMGALLGLYGSATAFAAFAPSDSPLLTVGSVTPNVMLLVDDSGSMNSIIWPAGFNPDTPQPQVYNCSSETNCLNVTALDMTDDNFFVGNLRGGGCGNGYDGFYKFTTNTFVCLKLPDPVGGGNTRYPMTYISYLLYGTSSTRKDYTDGTIPNDYRINVARTVSAALVASNRNLRIGLATFNPPTSRDSGPGGNIARPISDLTQTTSTTTAQANTNYNSLISSINGLAAIANTPLAETYYEVTRYFRGMAPYYNSTPTTYTSPIQYRCQRNYGVVITDGLPTYDRTFPTNDPLGGANLPNWDGKNNDGANLNGDGEGDTLYLDDIAKFAYDIDMRIGGTDAAGKSWDATDFPTQNMFTYTVGFTAANAMLSDAAAYGKGTYYQATDSAGLNAALSAALNDITSRAGTGGGAASNSSSLSSTSVFFQTQYDPTDWRGTIKAFAIATDGSINTAAPNWSTDDQIVPGITATYESWNSLTSSVIALTYSSFAPLQQVALSANLPSGISGADLVQWSKGTNKTGLKTRTVLLGDVINSPLAYASPTDNPASDPAADNSYSTYLDIKSNSMSPSLVVNANDGLVNVIDPSTGKRLYAYMPSTVLANLHYVADPNYINGVSHKFLMDGQISIVDVQFASSWKTLAIGGAGSGGKGFYALQLFNAGASNTVKALWDISSVSTGFANMGYAYAKPEVAQLPDGRWAAFIANGYGSTNGVASLFVVDVSSGALIKEIPVDTSGNNGLSSVKLRVNAASVVQYAYAGDLKGQMWKFDFTSAAAPTGKVGLGGSPLFTASGGANQPITAQPVVGNNPNGGKMVYFGTGKLLEAADKTTTATQAFYAVWDNDGTSANYHESDLVAQAINGVYTASSGQFFTTTQNDVNYAAKKGFYLPLIYNNIATGERVIYSANLGFGRVRFTTAIVDTTDPCSSSGSSRFVDLDALSGRMLSYPVLDTNGDGQINSSDTNSSGFLVSGGVLNAGVVLDKDNGNQEFIGAGLNTPKAITEAGGVSNRRIMWRQIR